MKSTSTALIAGALVLLLSGAATAGEIYRCKDANGRVLVQDRPCPGTGEKIDVKPNATGPVRNSDTDQKLKAVNERLNARIKAEDDERAARRAERERLEAECQDYVDATEVQAPFLNARSLVVRQSAVNAINIQRRKYFGAGCNRVMNYFR